MKSFLLVFLLAVLPLGALAETPAPGRALVGRWLLDPERSDSIKPMMELMGAPWPVRQLVAGLRPTLTLTLMPTGLRVLSQTRVRETEREIVTDGERRESQDALKRTVTEWSSWQEDGALKVRRQVPLKDGPVVEIEAIWRLNGADMEIESVARAEGESTVRMRRVFTAVAP